MDLKILRGRKIKESAGYLKTVLNDTQEWFEGKDLPESTKAEILQLATMIDRGLKSRYDLAWWGKHKWSHPLALWRESPHYDTWVNRINEIEARSLANPKRIQNPNL